MTALIGNKFRPEITKQEVNELELLQYEGEITMVDQPADLPICIENCQKYDLLGFDTETKPAFRKGETNPVALIQLATPEQVFLIRTLKTGFQPCLFDLLNDTNITKVGAGLDDDLQRLRKFGEVAKDSFLDLNEYCKILGFNKAGVRNLTALIFNKRISKSKQTSNWENKELSPGQQVYAATDAWICRELYLSLKSNGL